MTQKRQHILQAARRCFLRQGFAATTIGDICAAAGVSTGAVYVHFKNKHEMFEALGSEAGTSALGRLEQVLSDPHATTLATLSGLAEGLFAGPGGLGDAQLDLQLWAAAIDDEQVRPGVLLAHQAFETAVEQLHEPFAHLWPQGRRGVVVEVDTAGQRQSYWR